MNIKYRVFPSDEYSDWIRQTAHADHWMAWQAGEENVKQQVIYMIQQCVDRDATLAKLADAVREL